MDVRHLAGQANRIGQFFAALPDRDEALEGVATHLLKFWAPRMRRQLLSGLDAGTADNLDPLVSEALRRHRGLLEPAGTP